jgi:D-alanyl-D-alanine carboxypeptidase (penicillin-binding protein 5/6)
MNALAKTLRMERTRFVNPHGMDANVKPLPYSTAMDMARLTRYAMNKAGFRFDVSQKERQISFLRAGARKDYLLRNTNELLGIKNIDGVKTGTTRKAGECVIISAVRPPESRQEGDAHVITPRRINVVVLGTSDRFNVAAQLLDRGWRLYDEWAAAGRPMKARARR